MAREKPAFRETLDRLDAAFPDKEALQRKEVAKFLGMSVQTVSRNFREAYNPRTKRYPKVKIAILLAE